MFRLPSIFCVSFIMLFLTACKEPVAPVVEEVSRPAKLHTVSTTGGDQLRSFPGEVHATDQAELAFRVSGELIEFPATRGKRVEKGELLARLDPADFKAALDQEQAQYDLSKAQFDRVAELVERQLVSQSEYDQRNALMKVHKSNLDRARNNLDYTSIYAPFDGVVARVMSENYESVATGQVIMILQTGKMIDVTINVPESIVARIERRTAQSNPRPVRVRFDTTGNETYEAIYKEHEEQADPATLTYKVTVSLPVPEGVNILPGMSATVLANLGNLLDEGDESVYVPIEAVFSAEEEPLDAEYKYVWVVDPDSMRTARRAVRAGQFSGANISVLEGLDKGELIIAAGVNAVQEGMLVHPMKREGGL
jgi:RND family efflux transporter MFP subunit